MFHFHRNTVHGLAEMAAACGLDHPNEFAPDQLFERISPHEVRRLDQLYDFFEPGQLLDDDAGRVLQTAWDEASAESFGRI